MGSLAEAGLGKIFTGRSFFALGDGRSNSKGGVRPAVAKAFLGEGVDLDGEGRVTLWERSDR